MRGRLNLQVKKQQCVNSTHLLLVVLAQKTRILIGKGGRKMRMYSYLSLVTTVQAIRSLLSEKEIRNT